MRIIGGNSRQVTAYRIGRNGSPSGPTIWVESPSASISSSRFSLKVESSFLRRASDLPTDDVPIYAGTVSFLALRSEDYRNRKTLHRTHSARQQHWFPYRDGRFRCLSLPARPDKPPSQPSFRLFLLFLYLLNLLIDNR